MCNQPVLQLVQRGTSPSQRDDTVAHVAGARRCACGSTAFGQPPGRCYAHAQEAEREQATHLLALARQGIARAQRLAARYPGSPGIQREAHAWLTEAQDDLHEAMARLAALGPLPSADARPLRERR